jgi:fatty-acyl-CoA synthase
MKSTMQDVQLTLGSVFRRGRDIHGDREVVSFEGDRSRHATFAQVAERAERLPRSAEHGLRPAHAQPATHA